MLDEEEVAWEAVKRLNVFKDHAHPLSKDSWISFLPKSPALFLDCGPDNAYTYEILQFKHVFPAIPVVGIEASFARYKKMLRFFPGILLNYAVSSTDEGVELDIHGAGLTTRSGDIGVTKGVLKRHKASLHRKKVLPSIKLDSLESKHGVSLQDAFIWADIDGSELDMINGASRILADQEPIGLLLEVWHPKTKHEDLEKPKVLDIINKLHSYGYLPVAVSDSIHDQKAWDSGLLTTDIIFLRS